MGNHQKNKPCLFGYCGSGLGRAALVQLGSSVVLAAPPPKALHIHVQLRLMMQVRSSDTLLQMQARQQGSQNVGCRYLGCQLGVYVSLQCSLESKAFTGQGDLRLVVFQRWLLMKKCLSPQNVSETGIVLMRWSYSLLPSKQTQEILIVVRNYSAITNKLKLVHELLIFLKM